MSSGTLEINGSLIQNNTATNRTGGGIYTGGGTTRVTNTTLALNSAAEGGGIFAFGGSLWLSHVSIIGNMASAAESGGGLYVTSGADIYMKNSVIADNTATSSPDCYTDGTDIISYGYNLFEDLSNCSVNDLYSLETDINSTDPSVTAQTTDGVTWGYLFDTDSPLYDAGSCTDFDGNTTTMDQRGVERPQGTTCDIGALELEVEAELKLAAHGGVAQFDGASAIDISSGLGVEMNSTGAFTIESWVKTSSSGALGDIFSNYDNASGRLQFRMTSDGYLEFGVTDGASVGYKNIISTTTINDDTWHHVSVVKDGITATIYIDGVDENSSSLFTHALTQSTSAIGAYTYTWLWLLLEWRNR